MTLRNIFLTAASILFFAFSDCAVLLAQSPASYTWDDGEMSYTIYLKPDEIIEFEADSQVQNVKRVDPAASVIRINGKSKLWKIKNSAVNQSLAKGKIPDSLKQIGKFSPVFTSSQDGTGPIRALPGNIIIYFNPDWNLSRVEEFAKKNKFILLERMRVLENAYVIKTEPGIENLILCDKIRSLPGVRAAFPNWWVEVYPR